MVPCDGRVLYCGEVVDGQMEQVKGVNYSLEKFLGPNLPVQKNQTKENGPTSQSHALSNDNRWYQDKKLYHVIIYLGPGNCHQFHSPVSWTINHRRHFHG